MEYLDVPSILQLGVTSSFFTSRALYNPELLSKSKKKIPDDVECEFHTFESLFFPFPLLSFPVENEHLSVYHRSLACELLLSLHFSNDAEEEKKQTLESWLNPAQKTQPIPYHVDETNFPAY